MWFAWGLARRHRRIVSWRASTPAFPPRDWPSVRTVGCWQPRVWVGLPFRRVILGMNGSRRFHYFPSTLKRVPWHCWTMHRLEVRSRRACLRRFGPTPTCNILRAYTFWPIRRRGHRDRRLKGISDRRGSAARAVPDLLHVTAARLTPRPGLQHALGCRSCTAAHAAHCSSAGRAVFGPH